MGYSPWGHIEAERLSPAYWKAPLVVWTLQSVVRRPAPSVLSPGSLLGFRIVSHSRLNRVKLCLSQESLGDSRAFLLTQLVENSPSVQEMQVRSLGQENPLEKEMATHSSILAWTIPWTPASDGLQSTGSQESDTTEQLNHRVIRVLAKGGEVVVGTAFSKSSTISSHLIQSNYCIFPPSVVSVQFTGIFCFFLVNLLCCTTITILHFQYLRDCFKF